MSEYGRVDSVLLVTPTYENNETTTRHDEGEWSAMRSGDLDGAFQCMKAVWPVFRQQRRGRVVFLHAADRATIASSTSLLGLLGFVHTLSREGAKYNIACNVVMGQS